MSYRIHVHPEAGSLLRTFAPHVILRLGRALADLAAALAEGSEPEASELLVDDCVMRFAVIRGTMTCLFVVTIFALYKYLPNKKIDTRQVLPAAILAGVMAELVRIIYVRVVPNLMPTQGPFAISVMFLLFVYIETFVVLGCAFLATDTERYPWMGFLRRKRSASSPS